MLQFFYFHFPSFAMRSASDKDLLVTLFAIPVLLASMITYFVGDKYAFSKHALVL